MRGWGELHSARWISYRHFSTNLQQLILRDIHWNIWWFLYVFFCRLVFHQIPWPLVQHTLPETNISSENRPLEKETIIFRGELLVLGSVSIAKFFFKLVSTQQCFQAFHRCLLTDWQHGFGRLGAAITLNGGNLKKDENMLGLALRSI